MVVMTKRRGGRDESVNGFLADLIRHKGWREKLEMHSIFPKWERVVAEHVAECARPLKIVKEVLWIEVENSTWMQQLQYEKFQILDEINRTLKYSRIRDIRFTLPTEKGAEDEYKLPHVFFESVDPSEVKRFEEQVSVIEDEPTREAMIRLWYLSRACRREKKKQKQ